MLNMKVGPKARHSVHERLSSHPWLEHYEVVVRRNGREHIVARTATRRGAELAAHSMSRRVEVSPAAVSMRRARGVHPANAAKACMLLVLLVLFLPWFWPRLLLSLVGAALLFGLLSSGLSWRQGGDDDR